METDNITSVNSPKKSQNKKLWLLIILLIVIFALVNSPKLTQNTEQNTPTQKIQKQSSISTPSAQTNNETVYFFDVPSFVGKNLDEIQVVLGTPQGLNPTPQQIQMGINEWDKTFTKNGKKLLVTYNISNKKIIDFFIETDDPSGKTKDSAHLLSLGNLKTNDPNYTVEFVKTIKDPSSYTGIKVIPN